MNRAETPFTGPIERGSRMLADTLREFRVGLEWSFAAEELDSVQDAIALLPEELREHCLYASGLIEIDVEIMAGSFDDAKKFLIENILSVVSETGLAGQPESAYVTDDISRASWRFVDGRLLD